MPTSTEKARPSDSSNNEGADLLAKVLRDPFELEPETDAEDIERHVSGWFTYLIKNFPLWSFQAGFFASYNPALPSAHPIGVIAESLFRDDGIEPSQPREADALTQEVQARRYRLIEGRGWHTNFLTKGRLVLPGGPLPSLNSFGFLMEDTGESPYDDPGRTLAALIADRESKSSPLERQEAQEAIDRFLLELGATRPPRRPSIPPRNLLKALVAEGRRIIDICWAVLPVSMSSRTRSLLTSLLKGPSEDEDSDIQLEAVNLWRMRLALPVLSRPELLALDDPSGKGRDILLKRTRLKSRRLAIWFLARRLGMDAPAISRKGVNARDSEKFAGIPNPVDAFVS